MGRYFFRIILVFLVTLVCAAASQYKAQAEQVKKLQIESAAFKAGDTIPKKIHLRRGRCFTAPVMVSPSKGHQTACADL